MMAEPQTAEEWVKECRKRCHTAYTPGNLMCPACAREYARQVGEAGREYDAILAEQLVAGNRKYAATSAHDGGMATAGTRISNAIRARPVKCP